MDYETKPSSRAKLRLYSKLFRSICGLSPDEPVDPVALLDKLPDFEGFEDVRYEIVYNDTLPGAIPAQCEMNKDGYLIQIKESIYLGAYEKGTGGHRMHIMHEIMHVFADKIGFKPIAARRLRSETPPYRSLEWIVMALAGEVMMPYEATKGMSAQELMSIYGVSKPAAEKRLKY
ncbi:MAG: ImmA/IrrE family metallo-endopeptidase [Eubacteriaceae bacterium]|nr:ImmA/IrrE family metallo-endopeptidase [Eubacteriaceae bacterium]